ncbi:MAG: hypothetical protein M3305_08715 [Actinomycetota bacterium]|nr:hypothetical protein [Actinomycetota bacterium]
MSRESFGNHVLIRYRWDEEAPEAGQFLMVRPQKSALTSDPFLPRPLFVHDYEGGTVSLLFEVRGRGTALLADEGTELAVSRPLGRGFALDTDGPVALIGAGPWVSPLKLLSKSLSKIGILHYVYLGVPETAPATYGAWISENYSGAVLVPTTASPDFSTHTVLVDSLGDLNHYAGIYASGPLTMLKAVKSASAGVVLAQLALCERMACADGSCYGCAAPVRRNGVRSYLRACIEGPVLPAEVLAW